MAPHDYIIDALKDMAKISPSSFSHAAVLLKNNKPIWTTMTYNIGVDHAEMRCCQRYYTKKRKRRKG